MSEVDTRLPIQLRQRCRYNSVTDVVKRSNEPSELKEVMGKVK